MRMLAQVALALLLAAAGARAGEPESIGGREAEWWRAANAARQAEIVASEEALAQCQEREAPPAYDAVDGYLTRGRDGRLRVVEIKRCDEERACLDAARAELDGFEDEARQLGVPPGWLR